MTRAVAPPREKILDGSSLMPTLAWKAGMQAVQLLGADHREGRAAFFAKRAAAFRGE